MCCNPLQEVFSDKVVPKSACTTEVAAPKRISLQHAEIYHPALAHPMQRLQIQLVIGLDRNKAHRRSRDGLRIEVVALVRLNIRLHILCWNQSHLVSLFPQSSAKKMRTAAGFHANQLDTHVRGKAQQLRTREPLAHHNLAVQVNSDQMKNCLTKINADGV